MFEALLSISYGAISNTIYNLLVGNRKYVSKFSISKFRRFHFHLLNPNTPINAMITPKYINNLIKEVYLLMNRIECLSTEPEGITLNSKNIKTINPDSIVSNLIQTVENRRKELGLDSLDFESKLIETKEIPAPRSITIKPHYRLESMLDKINKRKNQ